MTDIRKGFNVFLTSYPEKMAQVMLPPAQLKKITAQVDAEYGEFIQEHGIAGYDNGFIWSVNPLDYTDVVKDFTTRDPKKVYVIARTAFGDMFLWTGKEILMWQVNYNKISGYGESARKLYNFSFINPRLLNKTLYRDLFDAALKKLGPLTHNECYGFFPALSMGGSEKTSKLQKVELKPYLSIVSQA